jgi:hypothetical protein
MASELPLDFEPQLHGAVARYAPLVAQGQAALLAHLRAHPDEAEWLLQESYDKRYSPSTFVAEHGAKFKVGWYSKNHGYEAVREFSTLAEAVADYLLFCHGAERISANAT